MKDILYKIPSFLPSAIALLTLFYFTLIPQPLPPIEVSIVNFDKVVHIVMMFLVCFVITFDFTRRERQRELSLPVRFYVMLATIILGALIEVAQGTPIIHRGCDVWDGVANAIGCILAFFTAPPLLRRLL